MNGLRLPVSLRNIFLLLLFFKLSASSAFATNYYFSSRQGDDARSATDAKKSTTPWKTLAKLNTVFGILQPGDSVLFNRGEVFEGSLNITKSGNALPIVFAAYGVGAKPEISGFTVMRNWIQVGNGIWQTTLPVALSNVNMVLVNGAPKAVGRYPNSNAANKGYLNFQTFNGKTSITDQLLIALPNYTGGQVVIRKNRWVLDRNLITAHSGSTINYTSQSNYAPSSGYGYFLQNHIAALDTFGEWYYQTTNKIFGMYTGAVNPSLLEVKVAMLNNLVVINNQSNVTFNDLRFTGSASAAFQINNAQNVKLNNCDILFSGKDAITVNASNRVTIEKSLIQNTNNIAFKADNSNQILFKNNQIKSTGIVAGMGDGDSGSYEGILIGGNDNLVENNVIDSVGYVPLSFGGNNVGIKNNFINNFALVKDDGGGIYTWNNGANPPVNYGRLVSGNTITNGKGAGEGTPEPNKLFAHGIYIDDNASNVSITSNTVANCASYGVFIHNAHTIHLQQNTVYNNGVQLVMEHDNIAADKFVYGITSTDNIFFAKYAQQLVAEFKTNVNDIRNFGIFNNNFYCKPIDENVSIKVLEQVNGVYSYKAMPLQSWQSIYGKDLQSQISPQAILPYTINKTIGINKFINGNFTENINGLYAYAGANNCTTTLTNDKLDGGALKISFSNVSGKLNHASVVMGIGAIIKDKKYQLKFSLLGTNNNKQLSIFLRQSVSSYADLSDRQSKTITAGRTEHEIVFIAKSSETNASIVFDIEEQVDPLYFDNIKLFEVDANLSNPDDYISFFSNSTNALQNLTLSVPGIDVRKASYVNSLSLNPFSSAILMKQENNVAIPIIIPPTTCTATGKILREVWDNVSGTAIVNIPVLKVPNSSSQLSFFEESTNVADNFASRISGYICAPQTGNYTFWIAGDDDCELWISTNDSPLNKSRIAFVNGWTNFREWNKFASQQSQQIKLVAGQKYYIEALHKEGGGGDNLSVKWQMPNNEVEAPISGTHLSPYFKPDVTIPNPSTCEDTGGINWDYWENIFGTTAAVIPVNLRATKTSVLTSFATTQNIADNYGDRIMGYVCAPQTGYYTFYIASDDQGELWLSTNDVASNKKKIAFTSQWTNPGEYNKYASQQSVPIYLQAGQRYYIEALHNEGNGGDHLSVGWKMPNGNLERPILGSHLIPFRTLISSNLMVSKADAITVVANLPLLNIFPNPVSGESKVEFVSEKSGLSVIELYNLQGRLVNKLFNGNTKAGVSTQIKLDAQKLENGFYIVIFRSGITTLTKKIIVQK